ncbi:zinc-ribbon protein [Oleiphilus messinensis]|uniref:Zinc-ribbon protein n=1 Tax=Oleiphilus messinensis TaxID=141451 RepID=A0A1Y0I6N6_9GAMM|nr:zinc-ribbon and DUF3426 domain-containing protein [Oleiphilus messinensis]ARU55063.1 zinc-ribbon protein [Oleiphilus messinensis]
MSEHYLTQCPNCGATFKLQEKHLNAAGGKVRCGSCMKVFNARDHLLTTTSSPTPQTAATEQPLSSIERAGSVIASQAQHQDEPIQPISSQGNEANPSPLSFASTDTATRSGSSSKNIDNDEIGWKFDESVSSTEKSSPTESELEKALEDDTEFMFQDDPDADAEEESYTGSNATSSDDEFSTSFLEIDNEKSHQFSDALDDAEEQESGPTSDEQWAEKMLEELESSPARQNVTTKKEPEDTFAASPEPSSTHTYDQSVSTQRPQYAEPSATPSVTPTNPAPESAYTRTAEFSVEHHHGSQPSPHNRENDLQDYSRRHDAESPFNNLKIDPIQAASHSRNKVVRAIVWLCIIAALTIGLITQLAWMHFDKLVQYPKLRPIYALACKYANCQLPELVDLSQIKSQNLIVRSHPTVKKALIIDAVIVNQATFEQPFPKIGLHFSDINNNIVAERIFFPKEYLTGDAEGMTIMPSGVPVHLAIEVQDPGRKAVNYSISFHANAGPGEPNSPAQNPSP